MDETKEDSVDGNSEKHSSDESFPWEEWTVIDGQENPENRRTWRPVKSDVASASVGQSDRDSTSDAEEAQECIQVLPEEMLEQCPSVGSSEDSVDQRNDESDGVSVITESDVDEGSGDATGREVVVYDNASRALTDRPDGNADRMLMKVLNVMIACSLVAVIGLGAGRVLNVHDNRPISNEIDLVAMKMESSKLREQMNELSGVKELLEEIKASMLQERVTDPTEIRTTTENPANQLPHSTKQFKTLDPSFNQPDSTLTERLQIFLRTICLVLEDIRQPNVNTKNSQSTCDTYFPFSELKNLHALLNGMIDELEPSERSGHQQFLQNVQFQMNAMSDSLVNDLTRALDKLIVKNRNRVENISFKVNKKLCVLRNTLPSDSKLRKSLENNNTFIDKCRDIATKKVKGSPKKKLNKESKEMLKESSKEKLTEPLKEISREPSMDKMKESSATIEPPKVNKKHFKKREPAVNSNFVKDPRRPRLKRQNATINHDTVDTRKCYSNDLSSFVHDSRDSDDTCALLIAPPRSDWKFKHNASKIDYERVRKDERKKLAKEWPGKILLKGDREASRIWKKKSKDYEKSKLRKSDVSSYDNDDVRTMKRTKERSNADTSFGASLSEPPLTNSNGKYKKAYPSNPTSHRLDKNDETGNNEFIVLERLDENSKVQGNWQFERSRIRDQLRNDDASGNWYFDRVGNRKNSRMNCDGEKRDPRCRTLRR